MEKKGFSFCCFPSEALVSGLVPWILEQELVRILIEVVDGQEGYFLHLHCKNAGSTAFWLMRLKEFGATPLKDGNPPPILIEGGSLGKIVFFLNGYNWGQVLPEDLIEAFTGRVKGAPKRTDEAIALPV